MRRPGGGRQRRAPRPAHPGRAGHPHGPPDPPPSSPVGLAAADGRRWPPMAAVRADRLDALTARGWAALAGYGIRTVVELRNERFPALPGAVPGPVAAVVRAVAEAPAGGVAFHCGLGAATVERLRGRLAQGGEGEGARRHSGGRAAGPGRVSPRCWGCPFRCGPCSGATRCRRCPPGS
ncbi:tyrosine-protein phosphatase [Streptomyces sp. NPDC044571]|uniref:tyrosine-protein phosphatase n=1 Tax=Streptomyces sp. NPDC044571 TaxID=3155371 RepID=UPI0033EA7D95